MSGIPRQVRYYAYGIFRHEPHPHYPTEDNKFNPLQKIAYLQFQLFILPIVLASGLLYMYPDALKGLIDQIGGMALLGTVHFFLGGLFAAFLVAHIYLGTTGETIGENFRAIITGYGIKSHHPVQAMKAKRSGAQLSEPSGSASVHSSKMTASILMSRERI